jgi:RHS repeat-associated protein
MAYNEYDVYGNIINENTQHWPSSTYTYNHKKVIKKSYLDHEQLTHYLTNTKLPDTITYLDQTKQVNNYDAMGRIARTTDLPSGVATYHSYIYTATGYAEKEMTITPNTNPLTEVDTVIHYTYYDKFGREKQVVKWQASPAKKDVVYGKIYDNYGRVYKEFTPLESTYDDGRYVAIDTAYAAAVMGYESNPLSRVTSIKDPDWTASHKVYELNNQNDVAGYPANTLHKETTINGNGDKSIVFTDFRGRKIINRNTNSVDDLSQRFDSKYFYDTKDRLSKYVGPGIDTNNTQQVHIYKYDAEDKLISKKLPNKAIINYSYNMRDELVGMQDGNMLAQNRWLASRYDDYGRVIQSGFVTNKPVGLSNQFSINNILKETSYGTGLDKNRVTNYKSKILGSPTFIDDSYFYTSAGYLDSVSSNSILNLAVGSTNIKYTNDASGSPLSHITRLGGLTMTTQRQYDHQNRLQSVNLDASYNNKSVNRQLQQSIYNYRNELITKYQGKTQYSGIKAYLQKIDYHYLANGALAHINQPLTASTRSLFDCNPLVNSGETLDTDAKRDIYYERLDYHQPTISGSQARYNGEISAEHHQVKSFLPQAYTHQYDHMGRLLSSNHHEQAARTMIYDQSQEYDQQGKIMKLRRTALADATCITPLTIDSLTYTYPSGSSRLARVDDHAPCPQNITLPTHIASDLTIAVGQNIFVDSTYIDGNAHVMLTSGNGLSIMNKLHIEGKDSPHVIVKPGGCGTTDNYFTKGFYEANPIDSYLYDANGNMTYDPHKQLTIWYNHLDLPDSMVWASGNRIIHTYDADGNLLKKRSYQGDSLLAEINYVMGTEWNKDTLSIIHHSEGTMNYTAAGFTENYFIADHIGNTRLVYIDVNKDGDITLNELQQVKQYYPFGLEHEAKNLPNVSQNDYLYNGIRQEAAFDLDWGVAAYRTFDKKLAVWHQTDPRMEESAWQSPYAAMNNNPVSVADPMGDTGIRFGPSISSGVNLATHRGRMAAAHLSSRALMGNPSRTSVMGAGEMMGLIDAMAGANQIVFDWEADENGNLVAEDGDNALSLARYLGISESEALNILAKNGHGSVKGRDVVRTGSFNLQEITVTAEKMRFGVVNGVYGKLNADPTPGAAFSDGGTNLIFNTAMFFAAGPELLIEGAISRLGGSVLTKLIANKGYSTIYRAVSKAELDDIAKNGFRNKEGAYETGKLFAPTLEEAAQFGKNNFMFDGIPNTIVKVRVPNNILENAYKFGADGMNAISIPANQLNLLKGSPLKFSPWLK